MVRSIWAVARLGAGACIPHMIQGAATRALDFQVAGAADAQQLVAMTTTDLRLVPHRFHGSSRLPRKSRRARQTCPSRTNAGGYSADRGSRFLPVGPWWASPSPPVGAFARPRHCHTQNRSRTAPSPPGKGAQGAIFLTSALPTENRPGLPHIQPIGPGLHHFTPFHKQV